MPNFAKLLKDEISRVARKEQRSETTALKKSSASYRSEIAALKRRLTALEQQIKRLAKSPGRAAAPAAGDDAEDGPRLRFSAARLRARREKLGLSAGDMGKLVGVSGQTIYNWEAGKARPRASQLQAIAAVRKLGKREAAAKLGGEEA